ncbi:hypothetical protein QI349_02740 [Staphylococcus saprophyticus]|nr:hypothetical protein [Staphylococcus saprophyticus]
MNKYVSIFKTFFSSFVFFPGIVICAFLGSSIYYFYSSSQSIANLLLTAPNSNLSLLVDTLKTFWFDSLIISFAISSFVASIVITFQFLKLFFLIDKKVILKSTKREIIIEFYTVTLKLFVLLFITTFSFIILMAATKPANSSFTLNFLPYIGSILLFGYGILFKDKKKGYKEKDKSND